MIKQLTPASPLFFDSSTVEDGSCPTVKLSDNAEKLTKTRAMKRRTKFRIVIT
jgi:hypothetical protein